MAEITADEIKKIVESAITQALESLNNRYTALESRIEAVEKTAVPVDTVQRMIDISHNTLRASIQETNRLIVGWDGGLRQVEATNLRVIAALESAEKSTDRQNTRIDEWEKRLADEERCRTQVANDLDVLTKDLFGDPSRKDDTPSILKLIQDLPEKINIKIETEMAPVKQRILVLENIANDVTAFVSRRRQLERRFIEAGTYVVKLPMWQKVALVSGSGLLAVVIKFLESLSGG